MDSFHPSHNDHFGKRIYSFMQSVYEDRANELFFLFYTALGFCYQVSGGELVISDLNFCNRAVESDLISTLFYSFLSLCVLMEGRTEAGRS